MENIQHTKNTAIALAALGHESRLTLYTLLVRSGREGLNVGQISDHLQLPLSTLSHHLKALVLARLVVQEKLGREVISRADFEVMDATINFLRHECCQGITNKAIAA